jgi:hypothetical protein
MCVGDDRDRDFRALTKCLPAYAKTERSFRVLLHSICVELESARRDFDRVFGGRRYNSSKKREQFLSLHLEYILA